MSPGLECLLYLRLLHRLKVVGLAVVHRRWVVPKKRDARMSYFWAHKNRKNKCIRIVHVDVGKRIGIFLTISCWRGATTEAPNGGQKGTGLGSSTLDRTVVIHTKLFCIIFII